MLNIKLSQILVVIVFSIHINYVHANDFNIVSYEHREMKALNSNLQFCCDYFPWFQTSTAQIKNIIGYWISNDNRYFVKISIYSNLKVNSKLLSFKFYDSLFKQSFEFSKLVNSETISNLDLDYNGQYYHIVFIHRKSTKARQSHFNQENDLRMLLLISNYEKILSRHDI